MVNDVSGGQQQVLAFPLHADAGSEFLIFDAMFGGLHKSERMPGHGADNNAMDLQRFLGNNEHDWKLLELSHPARPFNDLSEKKAFIYRYKCEQL
jgi:hypothetical protein